MGKIFAELEKKTYVMPVWNSTTFLNIFRIFFTFESKNSVEEWMDRADDDL